MDANPRPRIWVLIEPLDDHAEGALQGILPAIIGDAVANHGCRSHAPMGDDQALKVLARPKAPAPCVVSASVDLFGVTARPGDDSEGRLPPVRAVATLADGFEFSAYLMPDEARRVAEYLKMR